VLREWSMESFCGVEVADEKYVSGFQKKHRMSQKVGLGQGQEEEREGRSGQGVVR